MWKPLGEGQGTPWGGREPGGARRNIAPGVSPSRARTVLLTHFLVGRTRSGFESEVRTPHRPRGLYSPRARPPGRPTHRDRAGASCPSERISRTIAVVRNATVSVCECERARAGRSSLVAAPRGGHACRRNRANEQHERRARPGHRPGISRRPDGSVRRARLRIGRLRGRSACRRRGLPESGPKDHAGCLAGGGASGRSRARRGPRGPGVDPWRSVPRTGGGGGAVALARAGDASVTLVHRTLWITGAPARLALIGLVKLYRATLSGWLGGQCRFYPTCSRYAEEAIGTRGAIRGVALAAWRVARCGPFTEGGVDHVPKPSHPRHQGVVHQGAPS